MTFIEQAITEALAQGYKPDLEQIPEAADFSPLQVAVAMQSDVFLERGFWEALGRGRRWTTDEDASTGRGQLPSGKPIIGKRTGMISSIILPRGETPRASFK